MGCGAKSYHEEQEEERQRKREAKAQVLGIPVHLGERIEKLLAKWDKNKDNLPYGVVTNLEREFELLEIFRIK